MEIIYNFLCPYLTDATHTPIHSNRSPYNFGRSFLGLSVLRFAVEKKIFKKYSNFTFFTPKGGGGVMSC